MSQPLDVSFFKPLKNYWSEVCHRYMQDNPGRVVTKYQFSSLFSSAWFKTIRPANIVSGFRKVGICPFDSSAIAIPDVSYVTEDANGDDGTGDESSEGEDDPTEELELREEPTLGEDPGLGEELGPQTMFSPEQLSLFETRYENGYVLIM